jgi:hypothetical protein
MGEELSYSRYMMLVARRRLEARNWRYGQTAFNVLTECRADLSEQIRGTILDPFYKDDNDLNPFFEWVGDNWTKGADGKSR